MSGALMLIVIAAWCFGTAIRLHLRSGRGRHPAAHLPASEAPDDPQNAAPADTPVQLPAATPEPAPERVRAPMHGKRRVPPSRAMRAATLDRVEHTVDLPRELTEEIPPELCVNIWRREIGGGETLVAEVTWDGRRVRWSTHDLSPNTLAELQRLVIERTGLWPGHGRAYVEGVAHTLADPGHGSRWRAEHGLRRTA